MDNLILIKGNLKKDEHKDIYWIKSFVENVEKTFSIPIIVAVSYEYIFSRLEIKYEEIDKIKNWLYDDIDKIFKEFCFSSDENKLDIKSIVKTFPSISVMYKFAETKI